MGGDRLNVKRMQKEALRDLQRIGQLVYYPRRNAWGLRGYQTRSVQGLIDRGLAWCGPLAAYPTAAGMRYSIPANSHRHLTEEHRA